jgi:uncharacterized protein (TIGR03545 family)
MRIWGIIVVLVVIGLGFGAAYFITDDMVEERIEYQASIINEAKVEVDGFVFSLFKLQLKWDRLQVTNPNKTMENTFETGDTEFQVEFWPLILANKVIVNNMKVTGFELGTERETDGAFEGPEDEENTEPGFIYDVVNQVGKQAKQNAEISFTDARDDLNVDSLMAKVELQSPDKIDSLRQGIEKKYTKWDSTLTNTNVRKEIQQVEATVNGINPKEIKQPKQIVEAIENIQKLRNQVDSLKRRTEAMKTEFEQDYGTTRDELSQVDNWIQDDYQRALSVAKLPDLDAQNIGKALFGENLLGDYATYLEYAAMAREYGSRLLESEDSTDDIPRYEGIDYHFTDKFDLPGFWFKNIELSGRTKSDIEISGAVKGMSSNQKKTGEPVKFSVSGKDANGVKLSLGGELNYLGDSPRESFKLAYEDFALTNTRISGSDLLPYDLNSGRGSIRVNVNIIEKRLDSKIDYLAEDINFDFASAGQPKNRLENLVREVVGSTNRVDVTALIDNNEGPLRVRVRSNIDDLFMSALRQTVSRELENAKRKIEAEVQQRVEGRKEQLEDFKQQKEEEILKRYEELQAEVEEKIQLVDDKKKELEERKKELEDSLKDEVKDRIGIDFRK